MVYPDIFIKTLIKQKLICGIVFEFKREKRWLDYKATAVQKCSFHERHSPAHAG